MGEFSFEQQFAESVIETWANITPKAKRIINNHSLVAGFVCMIPFAGLETFLYAIVLWSMYVRVAKCAGVPFWKYFFKNVLAGFIVNLIVVFILNHIADWLGLVGIGFILAFVIGWIGTWASGNAYMAVLKEMHKEKMSGGMIDSGKTEQQIAPEQNINTQIQQGLSSNMLVNTAPYEQCDININLLTCPDCGNQVSRRASACPNCGCPVSEMNNTKN